MAFEHKSAQLGHAKLWYQIAAHNELAEALNQLAVSYVSGVGVDKNLIDAYTFWSIMKRIYEDCWKNLVILEEKLARGELFSGKSRART